MATPTALKFDSADGANQGLTLVQATGGATSLWR